MAELQLVGLAAESQADQLMAEADAEDRLVPGACGCLVRIGHRLGIARPVGEKDAVGL